MFDVGFSEMLIIAAIALIAIGPKQLPQIARVVGKFIGDLKRSTSELTQDFNAATGDAHKSLLEARQTAEQAFADALTSMQTPNKPAPDSTSEQVKIPTKPTDK